MVIMEGRYEMFPSIRLERLRKAMKLSVTTACNTELTLHNPAWQISVSCIQDACGA
jgi:hypothetical protein